MSRPISLMLWIAVAAMALAGGAAIYVQLSGGAEAETARAGARIAFLGVLPLLMAGALVFAGGKLAARTPRLADDHRRHLEISLLISFFTALAIQAWMAVSLVQGAPFDRTLFLRLIIGWMGVSLAMRGNFMTKVSPPTGEGAPDPAAFARSMRTAGWTLVAIGAGLVAAAFALPLKPLFVALLAVGAILPLVVLKQRRAERGRAS